MNEVLEILKYTLPALIVFLTVWILMRSYIINEDKKRRFDLSMNQKDSILPLRLQAYERLIIFLERISPDSLVMRHSNTQLSSAQLQHELINAVRNEFEHDLSQQTYISRQGWEMIKTARNNVIKLINETASELKPDISGLNLSKRILENAMELGTPPSYPAIEFLKKEVRELF